MKTKIEQNIFYGDFFGELIIGEVGDLGQEADYIESYLEVYAEMLPVEKN